MKTSSSKIHTCSSDQLTYLSNIGRQTRVADRNRECGRACDVTLDYVKVLWTRIGLVTPSTRFVLCALLTSNTTGKPTLQNARCVKATCTACEIIFHAGEYLGQLQIGGLWFREMYTSYFLCLYSREDDHERGNIMVIISHLGLYGGYTACSSN